MHQHDTFLKGYLHKEAADGYTPRTVLSEYVQPMGVSPVDHVLSANLTWKPTTATTSWLPQPPEVLQKAKELKEASPGLASHIGSVLKNPKSILPAARTGLGWLARNPKAALLGVAKSGYAKWLLGQMVAEQSFASGNRHIRQAMANKDPMYRWEHGYAMPGEMDRGNTPQELAYWARLRAEAPKDISEHRRNEFSRELYRRGADLVKGHLQENPGEYGELLDRYREVTGSDYAPSGITQGHLDRIRREAPHQTYDKIHPGMKTFSALARPDYHKMDLQRKVREGNRQIMGMRSSAARRAEAISPQQVQTSRDAMRARQQLINR